MRRGLSGIRQGCAPFVQAMPPGGAVRQQVSEGHSSSAPSTRPFFSVASPLFSPPSPSVGRTPAFPKHMMVSSSQLSTHHKPTQLSGPKTSQEGRDPPITGRSLDGGNISAFKPNSCESSVLPTAVTISSPFTLQQRDLHTQCLNGTQKALPITPVPMATLPPPLPPSCFQMR